ncbi:MAG TPA: zf-HC2 domain-containing protein [Polyangia bacterium]|nr:zf-HC2 domain-containing protein [Polyangia bacterium]
MTPCNLDDLEALAGFELPPARAQAVEAHVASCPNCARELAWLRGERALMARRAATAAPVPAAMWYSLERRLPEEAAKRHAIARHWLIRTSTAVGLAFAAAILLMAKFGPMDVHFRSHRHTPEYGHATERRVDRALDAAEKAYRDAISELESERRERAEDVNPEIARRHEARLMALRQALDQARAAAGDDSEARLQLLEAYSTYMRSMQSAVLEEEVEVEK